VRVHLVDGTYELFRAYYGAPKAFAPDGREVGATRALCRTLLLLLEDEGATHVAIAFDHVIESFRNELYGGYKTSAGIEPDLWSQFPLAEEATSALGIVTWPMVEFEADDAIAAAAHRFKAPPEVEQVLICSPDKDLAQCVEGTRVVMVDRRRKLVLDEAAVIAKFGVPPSSIPDYLALVGDTADGYPGIPRWGERSSAAVLAVYKTLENIPDLDRSWTVKVRGAASLAESLRTRRDEARLYRTLARLRTDVPLTESLADLEWRGPSPRLESFAARIGDADVVARAFRAAEKRAIA
jgi:5'-3' exonuclease